MKRTRFFAIILAISILVSIVNVKTFAYQGDSCDYWQSNALLENVEFIPCAKHGTEEDAPERMIVSCEVIKGNESISLSFCTSFVKLNTNNAYDGIVLSERCSLISEDRNITNIKLAILPGNYLERALLLDENEILQYKCQISFFLNGENIAVCKPIDDAQVLRITKYKSITENDGEEYLLVISRIKGNDIQYPINGTYEEDGDSNYWTKYEEKHEPNRSLSYTGNKAKEIVGDDSWFTTVGQAMKKISSSRRICAKNSWSFGSAIWTDIIIWQYSLTEPTQTCTASIRLQMLYNTTIVYNGGNWSDLGANAGSLALRETTVGIKTTGADNNDFYYQVDQRGEYNIPPNGSSPVQEIIETVFRKIVPYGEIIAAGIDLVASFLDYDTGSYNSGNSIVTYDDDPLIHFYQNDGYVRNVLFESGNYCIYKDSNYQEQKVYIVKRPSNCLKSCTYQSHFDVLCIANTGIFVLYDDQAVCYQRSYT